jgi:hypothetical protein
MDHNGTYLDTVSAGDTVEIGRITEEAEADLDLLSYLERHAVFPRTRLDILAVDRLSGAVTARTGSGMELRIEKRSAALDLRPPNPSAARHGVAGRERTRQASGTPPRERGAPTGDERFHGAGGRMCSMARVIVEMQVYYQVACRAFQRQGAYRTANVAGIFTNTVFGYVRSVPLMAAFAARPMIEGYDAGTAMTWNWLVQALIAVVALWGWWEVAVTIRSGDVAVDLARPGELSWLLVCARRGPGTVVLGIPRGADLSRRRAGLGRSLAV